MRRIPIQLHEDMYRALKKRAFEEGRSIASIVRQSVAKHMAPNAPRSAGDFAFIGSGKSSRDRVDRVSENHDAALADAFSARRRRGR